MSRIKLLQQLLAAAESMIQGGLSETTRRRGQPRCACQHDPARSHGPHLYLTFRSEGNSRALYVPGEYAAAMSRYVTNRQDALGDRGARTAGPLLENEEVASFMDTSAKTIGQDVDLLGTAQIFRQTDHRRLPVLDEGKLAGQISRRDLLKATNGMIAISPRREKTLLYLSSLVERDEAPIE